MGVLWVLLNLDKGEYVWPSQVNLKRPDEHPYSTFIVWLIRHHWNADRVMLMADEDSRFDGWQDCPEKDKSEEYWAEFVMDYEDEYPYLKKGGE